MSDSSANRARTVNQTDDDDASLYRCIVVSFHADLYPLGTGDFGPSRTLRRSRIQMIEHGQSGKS